jgi:hypothetical protein
MSRSTQKLPDAFPLQPFMVGEERLMLRPIILGEIPQVERVLEAWRILVATGGRVLDAGGWEDFLDLLAASAGKPVAWLEGLTQETFEQLVGLVLALNETIWKPTEDKDEGEEMPWPELFQNLIEHGHAYETLQGYTVAQARAFLLQGFRRERESFAQAIQASGFAMVEGKAVQQVVKELRRG